MDRFSRREAVKGVGLAAGMATLGSQVTFGSHGGRSTQEMVSPRLTLQRIRLTGDAEQRFLSRSGRLSRAVTVSANRPERSEVRVEAETVVKQDARGEVIAYGLRFVCDPRKLNRFSVAGSPFVASRFCYSVDAIQWSPGQGLPVYSGFAPRFDYSQEGYYREAKWHQIVPVIDGRDYFKGLQSSDVCEHSESGQICFDVNDVDYDDNAGSYAVTIWSWS